MLIGVPKEIKNQEYRVGLIPASVRELVVHGHEVIVEHNAGEGIGADDSQYEAAGATIIDSATEVFAQAEMIVKVKEPQPNECKMLREGQILFTYLHLAPDPELANALQESGCTAIAYETVTDDHGGLPLLAPMSEVAGRLSITVGISGALVGVMLAVALLPPLVTMGIMLGSMHWHYAAGAGMLFAANVVCINFAASLTFLLQGIRPSRWYEKKKAKKAMLRNLAFWSGLLFILCVTIYLRHGLKFF